ncbi:hypothetical protein GO986_12120 [Deinococcus sp. HMF7620]|uniref:Uncharacterized protein n=1 Tax=Deinococcus arboris TaxID=2682977 RepID=A0A7C9I3I9_9DEIO|nr:MULTISPECIES: hypothetical protein [Deinococcus]MBZ9752137.1 hypothetical protein [Deinococcus betulae]MVN87511.1 hypothetical protein [Deinococcus arboris]
MTSITPPLTRLDIIHGAFRLQAEPGADGLDTITVTHVASGLTATPAEAKLRRVAFLCGPDGWRRVPRATTLDIEATLLAFNGRPTTMADRLRMDAILMP